MSIGLDSESRRCAWRAGWRSGACRWRYCCSCAGGVSLYAQGNVGDGPMEDDPIRKMAAGTSRGTAPIPGLRTCRRRRAG